MKTNKVSVSILIPYRIENEKVGLWTQERMSDDELTGLLEFPGGKVELGETHLDACLREVEEEVGVCLSDEKLHLFKTYSEFEKVLISVYLYEDKSGKFKLSSYKDLEILKSLTEQIPPNNKTILTELTEYFHRFKC